MRIVLRLCWVEGEMEWVGLRNSHWYSTLAGLGICFDDVRGMVALEGLGFAKVESGR